jgi:two-component system, OmpR family, phosphate regulon response regulator OmpR
MKRVLGVEADEEVGRLLDLVVSLSGYAGQVAPTLEEARWHLGLARYDLVLVDLVLPDGDGLQLCREVRAADPAVPIIAVSARADPQVRDQAVAAGAAHVLPRPCNPETLERVIRITLGDTPDRRRAPRPSPTP